MEYKLHESYRIIEKGHWWFVGRRKVLFDVLDKYIAKQARVLDVGCNSGILVEILQNKGYDALGSDISAESVEYGKTRGVKNLFVSDGRSQPFPDASFDCVLALDVIEHIDDDTATVGEFERLLKPGGVLIVMVPAFMFMWGIQDEVAHHKRRYTRPSLNNLAMPDRFDILRLTYFNSLLFVPIVVSRLLQKIFKPKRDSDFDMNNKVTNYILGKIFLFEAQMLKWVNFPFGVSILMVARKK